MPWCLSVGYMFVHICIPRPSMRGTDVVNSSVKLSEWRIWLKNLATCSHRPVFRKVMCDAVVNYLGQGRRAGSEPLLEWSTGFTLVL